MRFIDNLKSSNMTLKEQVQLCLGERIRTLRLEKGLTIKKLAAEAEMEYVQLSRIELGKINTTAYQLFKLSKALSSDMSILFKNFNEEV